MPEMMRSGAMMMDDVRAAYVLVIISSLKLFDVCWF